MTSAGTCPDQETIDDLLGNRLPSEQAEQIRSHIANCPDCSKRAVDRETSWFDARTVERVPGAAIAIAKSVLSPPRGADELGWLGEFRVLGVLGEGGMAVVYDAEDPKLGRLIALKILKPEIDNASTRERFLREAKIVASLASDHVVDVYAVGEANNTPFMAMEKLNGETLAARLHRDRWLSVVDALAIVREAAEGLVDLHAHGLIHRDLKPDNIWLESHDDRRVKLIDFGIARQKTGDPSLTIPGQVIGTPIYMAPEQASGGDIDARADLYSLGCVLYRMLAGRTPFDGLPHNTLAVLGAVIRGDIAPIGSVAPSLSPAVAALVQQLLEHDREKRPRNAAELATRLRELELEEGSSTSRTKIIEARAAQSKRRMARETQPMNVALGVIALAAAIAVGGMALWTRFTKPGEPGPLINGDPPKPPVVAPSLSGEPIKVGVLFSTTDATAIPEAPILDAVEFAIEEINKTVGVLGRPIEMVFANGASDPAVFARKAAKLIDEDKVEVIFGCWSSPSRKLVAEVCSDPTRDRLLFYAGNSEGLEDYQNVVYLGGAPNQILTPLIRYAYSDLVRRKVYVVGTDSIYSRVINDLVEHEVTRLEGSIAGKRNIIRGEADFRSIADDIKATQANFVVSSLSGADNVVLERALRGAGLRPPEVPTAWLTVTESNLAYFPPSLAGDYSASCYFHNSDKSDGFVRRYRKHYGEEERLSDTMEAAFYGVYLWKEAVEKAKSSKTADVRQALRGMTMTTPDGQIKIDTHSLHAWQTGQVSEILYSEPTGLTFKTVYRTPEPVAAQLYPPWKTKEEWNQFVDGLFQEWGKNWERIR